MVVAIAALILFATLYHLISEYISFREPQEPVTHVEIELQDDTLYQYEPKPYGMFMSAKDKREYLNSTQWQKKRERIFSEFYHTCPICAREGRTYNRTPLNLHHISYAHLGDEPDHDLVPLCEYHHNLIHKVLGKNRKTIFDLDTVFNKHGKLRKKYRD